MRFLEDELEKMEDISELASGVDQIPSTEDPDAAYDQMRKHRPSCRVCGRITSDFEARCPWCGEWHG